MEIEDSNKLLRKPILRPIAVPPPYVFQKSIVTPPQDHYVPTIVPVKCGGYGCINVMAFVEGTPGDDFYLLVDYSVTDQFEMQITNLGSEVILPGGVQVLQVGAYRPMMPEFNIIIASMANAIFKKVCVTVYATLA